MEKIMAQLHHRAGQCHTECEKTILSDTDPILFLCFSRTQPNSLGRTLTSDLLGGFPVHNLLVSTCPSAWPQNWESTRILNYVSSMQVTSALQRPFMECAGVSPEVWGLKQKALAPDWPIMRTKCLANVTHVKNNQVYKHPGSLASSFQCALPRACEFWETCTQMLASWARTSEASRGQQKSTHSIMLYLNPKFKKNCVSASEWHTGQLLWDWARPPQDVQEFCSQKNSLQGTP
jgi:hypothetical protein